MDAIPQEYAIAVIVVVVLLTILVSCVVVQLQKPRLPTKQLQLPADRSTYTRCVAAFGFSVLFVGTGQVYNRQVLKGVAFIVASALAWQFLLGWIVHILAIVDAVYVAHYLRRSPWRHQLFD